MLKEDDQDPRPWDVLESRHLIQRPWLTVRQDRVRLPNGAIIDDYNILEYPDWVNVVPITPDGRVVLIRQYRHGSRRVHYELPAGVVDATDADLEQTARRELLEETGHGGGEWSRLTTLSANPGTHTNLSHTFLARGVVPLGEPAPEETEEIRVHAVGLDELREILASGGVLQALHAAPLYRYLLTLGE
ncbi:NUDIX hydrolase [Paludisphaera sp.]|uniref:NUDIX hydrolase n=1 Tax=Paludisphaera sp. TaxID=2017432 RepID=UPI00301C858B